MERLSYPLHVVNDLLITSFTSEDLFHRRIKTEKLQTERQFHIVLINCCIPGFCSLAPGCGLHFQQVFLYAQTERRTTHS